MLEVYSVAVLCQLDGVNNLSSFKLVSSNPPLRTNWKKGSFNNEEGTQF